MWALPLKIYSKKQVFCKNMYCKGKMYKLMSQNLLKRAITNKPIVGKFMF